LRRFCHAIDSGGIHNRNGETWIQASQRNLRKGKEKYSLGQSQAYINTSNIIIAPPGDEAGVIRRDLGG
jgi:hypothetical protein